MLRSARAPRRGCSVSVWFEPSGPCEASAKMIAFVDTRIVSTKVIVDTSQAIQVRGSGLKRRFRTVEEKRRIVEETLQPGGSVAGIARAHGVNANQVFTWRRLYQQQRAQPSVAGVAEAVAGVDFGQAVEEIGHGASGALRAGALGSTAAVRRRWPPGD